MGASARKKREKKKDFQKAKLKVGKVRPKNSNATDTSFTAKSIVLKEQSLGERVPERTVQFQHQLSLTGARSESQRRDALNYLTNAVMAGELSVPASTVLAKTQPLIMDADKRVRQALLDLFHALPSDQLSPKNFDQATLYARAGMTHLAEGIRKDALDMLQWVLKTDPDTVLSGAGNWIKGLRTFQTLLAWHDRAPTSGRASGKWTAPAINSSRDANGAKLLTAQLSTLAHFLEAGLGRPSQSPEEDKVLASASFPLWHTGSHMSSTRSNPFGILNLFGTIRDAESEVYATPEERANVFLGLGFRDAFSAGVKEAKKEAGEVGRAASCVEHAFALAVLPT